MYCANCGVRLADTEKHCPLCGTEAYHPEIRREFAPPLYPDGRMPKTAPRSKAIHGVILILFAFPVLVSLVSDWQFDKQLDWFAYVAVSVTLSYILVALPLWFRRPNPIIFVPCDFAAVLLFLLCINALSGGDWFLTFAFPVTTGVGLVVSALTVLLRCLKKGRLYIWGGAMVALGGLVLLVEYLLNVTFAIPFLGWSLYPLLVLGLLGVLLIYLGINRSARELMERKLFF